MLMHYFVGRDAHLYVHIFMSAGLLLFLWRVPVLEKDPGPAGIRGLKSTLPP